MCAVESYESNGLVWINKTLNSVQECGLIKFAGLWADNVRMFIG